jgi:hypothetical protein
MLTQKEKIALLVYVNTEVQDRGHILNYNLWSGFGGMWDRIDSILPPNF